MDPLGWGAMGGLSLPCTVLQCISLPQGPQVSTYREACGGLLPLEAIAMVRGVGGPRGAAPQAPPPVLQAQTPHLAPKVVEILGYTRFKFV